MSGKMADLSLVEEGVPVGVMDDAKSDAGSATTTPSVESGNSAPMPDAAVAAPRSRRRMLLGGGMALVVIAGVITAAVVGTCDKHKTSTSMVEEEDIVLGGVEDVDPMFFPKPFGDIELPLFQADVLQAYESREAFEADLTKATMDVVNRLIAYNLMNYGPGDNAAVDMVTTEEEVAVQAAVTTSTASAAGKQPSKMQQSMKMTNNQERDSDEGDLLKTDGTYVYAVYGDYVVVWDLEGNLVTSERMPVNEVPERTTEDDMYMGDQLAFIQSIQLTENHVLLVVGGTGQYKEGGIDYGTQGTNVRVYNKPTEAVPSLKLVATRDINGYFWKIRFLEATNSIHILTSGDLDTYTFITGPIDPYNFINSSRAEYYEAAVKLAKELIPKFVEQVADLFIGDNDGQLPSLMKVNQWFTQEQYEKSITVDASYGVFDEAVRSYTFVNSIAVGDLPTSFSTQLPMSTTGFLGPTTDGFLYGTKNSLVLQNLRYVWDEAQERSDESMYLIHLLVAANGTASFHSIASLAGTVRSAESIDILGNDLRIATGHRKWMPMDNVFPTCGENLYFEDKCINEKNWQNCFDVAMSCRNVVKKGCPYTFECADVVTESSTDNFVHVFDISQPGMMKELGSVRIGEPHETIMAVHFGESFSYANTFDQRDPFYVLKLDEGKPPVVAGELKIEGFSTYLQPISKDGTIVVGIGRNIIGEDLEQRDIGLLATVFNVSNPKEPTVLAMSMFVDPDEYDSYSDAEWEAKAVQYNDGILVIPLQMMRKYNETVFSEEAMLVATENTEVPMDWTSAPDNYTTSVDFDGFVVLDVSNVAEEGIKEVTRINHAQRAGTNCYYCNSIYYRRSFLFDDKNLMTVYNNAAVSTDVTTGKQSWVLNITLPGATMDCCY